MSDLTETEQKYGVAPKRGAGVVYQDQVVLVEHGDKAVKSWNTNGLEWTLDGSDPQINGLQEGQILFATSRCVGRVLKLTRSGNDVTVILGPVQLTDVIKQGNFTYDQPLDLNSLTAVEMPDYPGAFGSPYIDQMRQAQGGARGGSGSAGAGSGFVVDDVRYYVVTPLGEWRPMRTVGRARDTRIAFADDRFVPRPRIVRTSWSPPQSPNRTFNNVLSAAPCFTDCGGLGVRMTATKAGLTLNISVVFRLERPRFTFNAGLYHSNLHAQILLTGGAGFLMTVEGTTDPSFTTNLNETGAIPVDLIMPIAFGPLPLELHYHQDLSIATAFSAKTSLLRSRSDFKLVGNLGFIYQDGHFDPLHMYATQNNSLSGDVNGVSMGINSIVVAIDQRLLAGLGAGGFAVGPYVGLTSTATALKQATEAGEPDAGGRTGRRLPSGDVRDAGQRRHRLRHSQAGRRGHQLLPEVGRRRTDRGERKPGQADAGEGRRAQVADAAGLRGEVATWLIHGASNAPESRHEERWRIPTARRGRRLSRSRLRPAGARRLGRARRARCGDDAHQ